MGWKKSRPCAWNLCEGNSNESVANEKVMEMLSNASNGEKEKISGDTSSISHGMSRSMNDWASMAFKLDGLRKVSRLSLLGNILDCKVRI